MKKLLFLIVFCLTAKVLSAQPGFFNYQAVVRNANGEILPDQNVSFQIEIIRGTPDGTVVYRETHDATTNTLGLVTLKIFDGTNETMWPPIDWSSGNFFIKVYLDADGGNDFVEMGTSQLLSVPFAMHAGTVENEKQALSVNNEQLSISDGNTVDLPTEYRNFYVKNSFQLGTDGIYISDITEITGKTSDTENYVDIDLPKEYNANNTSVFCIEIKDVSKFSTLQYGLGYTGINGTVGYYLLNYEPLMGEPSYQLRIFYPDELKEKDFRAVLIRRPVK